MAATRWAESALSIDEVELAVRCGAYDPNTFVVLSREGLLRSALCHDDDNTCRHVDGEQAGAWISRQLGSLTGC